ncbi:MAG: carboxypeptidase-like regulatory domain-containing protein [Gemmatimonadaceae bacterium]
MRCARVVVRGTLCLTFMLAARSAVAQEPKRYDLRGVVRDSLDAPIASASVTVYGFSDRATTNARGEFALSGLLRGTRVLEAIAVGFRPRVMAVAVSDSMPRVVIVLARSRVVVLDSMQVTADRMPDMPITSRRTDRITRQELSQRQIIGGSALEAFALLRPQLFHGRPPPGFSATNDASQRASLFPRDTIGGGSTARTLCVGNRACEIDGQLSVSINEGRPGSPDILTTLPVRIIKEMRYFLAVDAAARFGMLAGGGPVLVVYTR